MKLCKLSPKKQPKTLFYGCDATKHKNCQGGGGEYFCKALYV